MEHMHIGGLTQTSVDLPIIKQVPGLAAASSTPLRLRRGAEARLT